MVAGRLLRVTGTVLLMAVALVTPVLALPSTPASADVVIDGCIIVSNPTPTHFTNCPGAALAGANLSGLNLSFANFAGAFFAGCSGDPSVPCPVTDLADANLTDANLTGVVFLASAVINDPPFPPLEEGDAELAGANLSGANLSNDVLVADLTNANLTGATLTGAVMSSVIEPFSFKVDATLSGANFTNTILVPSNESVTATSQAGAVATWSTPAGISGATPGSCTPESGSTFPLFSSTVTCQVLDADNNSDVATGTFSVTVQPTTQYFTRVVLPTDGATLTGRPFLDALAGNAAGVTKVLFELSGGTLSDQVIATATPTLYGWLAQWNSATVPNGTYSLQSVATDAANNTDTSTPISVTVSNPPASTAVLIPSGGASVSGASSLLDASASSPAGLASVTFELSGGTLSDRVIGTATPTLYGWLAQWDTTKVPNGGYTLQSVVTDKLGLATTSAVVSVVVANAAPTTTVLIPSNGATQSGRGALLDASASSDVTQVNYELSGGPSNLADQVIASGLATSYGWLAQWDTTKVPDGTYSLQSVASYAGGVSGTSPLITITVAD